MRTKYDNSRDDDMYVITAKDAHGFPELYIKGFGWVSFEPTMTTNEVVEEDDHEKATNTLAETGIVFLGISVLVFLFLLAYPVLAHKIFIRINNRKSPNEAIAGVMRRTCRLYGVHVSATSHEAEKAVKLLSGADISQTALLFDKAEYGGAKLTENDKEVAMREYNSAYTALNEYRKRERKQKFTRKK